jgi:hypothetical protein
MFLRLLPVVGASVVSLWLAAFVTMPRKPLPNNEVQELVYARLLGRQHRAVLLATIVTALGFFALVLSVPVRPAAHPNGAPSRRQICFDGAAILLTCYTPQPGGMWIQEELQASGTWRVVGVSFSAPHPPGEKGGALDP